MANTRSNSSIAANQMEPILDWSQARNHARLYASAEEIEFGNVCSICQEQRYDKCWMFCQVCNRPVVHMKCLRRYVVQGQFGPKKCPSCNLYPIQHANGHQSNFPTGWKACYVICAAVVISDDDDNSEPADDSSPAEQ